jgi:hypothetical protein
MNQKDFAQWFAAHRAQFAMIDAWIANFPTPSEVAGSSDPNRVTQASLAKAWFNTLADLDIDPCLEATRLMAKGDEALPASWDLHPQRIRAIAKRLATRTSSGERFRFGPRVSRDGEETFRCLMCRDDGMVLIFHDAAVVAMRKGTYGGPRTVYTAMVICDCEAGEYRKRQRMFQDGHIREYSSSRDVRIESGMSYPTAEDVERLRQFVESEKREPAFDAWK